MKKWFPAAKFIFGYLLSNRRETNITNSKYFSRVGTTATLNHHHHHHHKVSKIFFQEFAFRIMDMLLIYSVHGKSEIVNAAVKNKPMMNYNFNRARVESGGFFKDLNNKQWALNMPFIAMNIK